MATPNPDDEFDWTSAEADVVDLGDARRDRRPENWSADLDDEHDEIGDADDFERELLARFAVELVDAGRIDQMHAAARDFAPCALRRVRRRAVQHADRERVLAEQRVRERRLADADAPEHREMHFAALELFEHRVEPREIAREVRADRGRDVRIVEQRAQAFGRLHAVRVAARGRAISRRRDAAEPRAQASPPFHRALPFDPAPF